MEKGNIEQSKREQELEAGGQAASIWHYRGGEGGAHGKVRFERRLVGGEGVGRHSGDLGRRLCDRGNNQCKGPGAGECWCIPGTREPQWLDQREGEGEEDGREMGRGWWADPAATLAMLRTRLFLSLQGVE